MEIGKIFRTQQNNSTSIYRIKSIDEPTYIVDVIDIEHGIDYFRLNIENNFYISSSELYLQDVVEIDQEEFERLLLEAEILLKMNTLALISKPLPSDYTEVLNKTLKKQMSDKPTRL